MAGQSGGRPRRPDPGLSHRPAHGAGPFRQHRQFPEDLSQRHRGGHGQGLRHDGQFLWARPGEKPGGGSKRRHPRPGPPHPDLCLCPHGPLARGHGDL